VIAYFDTSAIVPLLFDELGTERCRELWLAADRLVTTRLARVEARAALAQAERSGRISRAHLRSSSRDLGVLLDQVEFVEVDDGLTRTAGDLAEAQALRAYDAVHLAAADEAGDSDLVVVAGDQALLAAARSIGLAVTDIS
jgi:predicted nucleic acid-binding protein